MLGAHGGAIHSTRQSHTHKHAHAPASTHHNKPTTSCRPAEPCVKPPQPAPTQPLSGEKGSRPRQPQQRPRQRPQQQQPCAAAVHLSLWPPQSPTGSRTPLGLLLLALVQLVAAAAVAAAAVAAAAAVTAASLPCSFGSCSESRAVTDWMKMSRAVSGCASSSSSSSSAAAAA